MTKEKKITALEELIRTLEPKEKRYVNIYLNQFKTNSDYVKVFNIILSSKEGLENELNDVSENSAVIKVQLYWKILKALQLYRSETNAEIKKNELLSTYVILEEKGLTNQALKILNQLSDFCKHHNFIDDLLYIERKKIRIYIENNDQQKKEHYLSLFNKESLKNIKAINQVNTLLKIYYQNKLSLQFFNLKIDLNAVKIINSYLNKLDESEILSENGMFFYHFNKSIYYILINEIDLGLHYLGITIKSVFGESNYKTFYSVHQNDILEILFELIYINQIDELFKKLINEIELQLIKTKVNLVKFQLFKIEVDCYLNWKNDNIKELILSNDKLIHYTQQHGFLYNATATLTTVRLFIEHKNYKKCWLFLTNLTYLENRFQKLELQLCFKLLKLVLSIMVFDLTAAKADLKIIKTFIINNNISSDFCNDLLLITKKTLRNENKSLNNKLFFKEFDSELTKILLKDDYKINYEKLINFTKFIKNN